MCSQKKKKNNPGPVEAIYETRAGGLQGRDEYAGSYAQMNNAKILPVERRKKDRTREQAGDVEQNPGPEERSAIPNV